MRIFVGAALAALMVPGASLAGEAGDRLAALLYAGEAGAERALFDRGCAAGEHDACFGLGLVDLIGTVEGLSQAFYRHGAVAPDNPAAALLLGFDADLPAGPANPNPEKLTYAGFRDILEAFVAGLDQARGSFEQAGAAGDYVLTIDPLRVRFDIDGDGNVGAGETLAGFLKDALALDLPQQKSKGDKAVPLDTTIGFDRADALWFSGYSQISAAPVDFILAHDFSEFFAGVMHRVFPKAGLPMGEFSRGGTLLMDATSDAFIADAIVAIHTAGFPVTDGERLKGVLARLKAITGFSRQNWDAILAETDDNRELVPSPAQTSLVPGQPVTEEIVAAWMATLDSVDAILAGELLLPHWRFRQGFDLSAYFETAEETDLVMLLAGPGALPFLADGKVADADSFAMGNRVFGDNWLNFALWFN